MSNQQQEDRVEKAVANVVARLEEKTGEISPSLLEDMTQAVKEEFRSIVEEKQVEIHMEDKIRVKGMEHTSSVTVKGTNAGIPSSLITSGIYKSALLFTILIAAVIVLVIFAAG